MINPSEVSIADLPSVALEDRKQLPTSPCIYFAIDSLGAIQYIGRAVNLGVRWYGHQRFDSLSGMGGVRISYIQLDADLLANVEAALIEWFDPPLNKSHRPKDDLIKIGTRIPKSMHSALKVLAAQTGKNMDRIVQEAIAEHIKRSVKSAA